MIENLIRDQEVLTRKCYKMITIATNAIIAEYSKVVMLDGAVLRVNFNTSTISATAPVAGAGEALVSCGSDSEVITLCEFDTTGAYVASFLRVYTFDEAGVAVTKDYELDGVTAYVVTVGNTVKTCGEGAMVLNTFAAVATNASPVVVPANVKSFSVLNLGENGTGFVYTNIAITGGLVDTILGTSPEVGFTYSVSEDQDVLAGAVTITPAGLGQAKVRRTV